MDYWQTTHGFRRELDTQSGALTLDQPFAVQSGTEFSPALGMVWQPTPELRARASAYQAFRVPTLNEYYRPAQVPRHTFKTSATWNAPLELQFTTRARWISAAYEDDENTLRLSPAATFDFGLARRFARRWEVFIAIENAFDTDVETGRTASGIVNIAPPRWIRAGLRYGW